MTASAFPLGRLYLQDAVVIRGDTVLGGLHGDFHHHHCAFCLFWAFTRADVLGPPVNIRSTLLTGGADDPPFLECWLDERLPWMSIGAAQGFRGFPPAEGFSDLMAEFAALSR